MCVDSVVQLLGEVIRRSPKASIYIMSVGFLKNARLDGPRQMHSDCAPPLYVSGNLPPASSKADDLTLLALSDHTGLLQCNLNTLLRYCHRPGSAPLPSPLDINTSGTRRRQWKPRWRLSAGKYCAGRNYRLCGGWMVHRDTQWERIRRLAWCSLLFSFIYARNISKGKIKQNNNHASLLLMILYVYSKHFSNRQLF